MELSSHPSSSFIIINDSLWSIFSAPGRLSRDFVIVSYFHPPPAPALPESDTSISFYYHERHSFPKRTKHHYHYLRSYFFPYNPQNSTPRSPSVKTKKKGKETTKTALRINERYLFPRTHFKCKFSLWMKLLQVPSRLYRSARDLWEIASSGWSSLFYYKVVVFVYFGEAWSGIDDCRGEKKRMSAALAMVLAFDPKKTKTLRPLFATLRRVERREIKNFHFLSTPND